MTQAPINEQCIIGLPQCGYAFQSSRQAFIAIPNDENYKLELQILQDLLAEKQYNHYVALEHITPGQLAFCGKICAQIIQSQFCIAILNPSRHKEHADIMIPNPNVHMEYGLMLGFHKYVLPFQRDEESLAFNISPLDTVKYTFANFKQKANDAIDEAILNVGVPSMPPKQITNQRLFEYFAVRGVNLARIATDTADTLYKMGQPLGYNLLEGSGVIVYLGLFELDPPNEVLFKAKLLVQTLHNAKQNVDERSSPEPETQKILDRLQIEIIVAPETDVALLKKRFEELTKGFWTPPMRFLTMDDIEQIVQRERDAVGEL